MKNHDQAISLHPKSAPTGESDTLLLFLDETKQGLHGTVERSSFPYVRLATVALPYEVQQDINATHDLSPQTTQSLTQTVII